MGEESQKILERVLIAHKDSADEPWRLDEAVTGGILDEVVGGEAKAHL